MNKIITLIMVILFANTSFSQSDTYSKLWKDVEKLEIEGLPKSALKVVETIESKAKAESNSPQVIKTLLFKSKFMLVLEEEAQLNIINNFKTEIKTSKVPTKNVLENILATLYWQYFKQNRWKFYNRTKTNEKVETEDFRTWDLETLFQEINLHYKNSLANGLILQQTDLKDFDVILTKQKDSKIYRPTVFDLLAHNALDFYKHQENSIAKPAYKFIVDDTNYLAPANTFANLNITSKDSSSLTLNALKLYQELIKFHLKDTEPFALTNVNIDRLNFAHNHATFIDKDSIYINTLKTEIKKNKTHEVSALYNYNLASIYNAQGNEYNPETNTKVRWKIKDAIAICDSTIAKFPNSKGAQMCQVLKQQIENPSLQLTTEGFLPINTNTRILVTYKDLNNLEFSIFKLTEKQHKTFSKIYRQNEKEDFIAKLKATKNWEVTLKNEQDYQTHTTEVLIPKLNNGRYLIYAKSNELNENFTAHTTILVTYIAITEYDDSQKKHIQFIDRNNGKPITNAKVEIEYYYRNKLTESTTKTTNEFGKITINKARNKRNNANIKITNSGDVAYFNNLYINSYYSSNNNKNTTRYNAFLFTDRSIYRPGQTVYFKAIAMKTKDEKSSVLEKSPVDLTLHNVNGETVKTLHLKTNEFGSVSGEFILPNNGLTGDFEIEINGKNNLRGHTNFSVEEYKRPKFETNFKPITETIKVNDSVTVNGEALAFAGSKISNAKVVYRVKRNVQYPRWYAWSRPMFQDQGQEITHGETTTDSDGNYKVVFKAIPDESVDKKGLPIFKYEVTADVTDINGETRSTTTTVNVGYHALTASISINSDLDKAKKNHEIIIDTKNLNGEFVAAQGTLKIYKLKAPEHVLRTRPWQAPDYQNFTKEEFKTLFPHEAYKKEHNPEHWKKDELVFNETFDTEKSKTITLKNIKKWESGQYSIVLETKDKFGQAVKDEAKTRVFSEKDKVLEDNQLFQITTNKEQYAINDTAEITLATAAKNILVTVEIEKNQKITNTYIVALNQNKKTIEVPVSSKDIGGFAVHYSFAAFNEFKSGSLTINVPYPKTDLEIETLTFRDKLQPGTDETWKFKIKGPKGDKVSAELLASMYDASLDEFKTHNWSFNPIYRSMYHSRFRVNAHRSFGNTNFNVNRDTNFKYSYTYQNFDQLNWFGFYFGNSRYLRRSLKNNIYNEDILEMSAPAEAEVNADFVQTLQGQVSGLNISTGSGQPGAETEINLRGVSSLIANIEPLFIIDGVPVDEENFRALNPKDILSINVIKGDEATAAYGNRGKNGVVIITTKNNPNANFDKVQIRKNLKETAFFFPQLQTNEKGEVSFSFTTPEALTKWKLQLLAHTKTLEHATTSLATVTQKELMVLPNVPRFLRQGDKISISTKISNLTNKDLNGITVLQLFDALTGKSIDSELSNVNNNKNFTVDAKGNTSVTWNLNITDNVQAIQYKIIAKSGDYSDGEQNALPVLTNRMLVTESLPMWIRSNQTKTFTLDKLKNNTSTTLKNHKLTLEMTSNPAWYAVQALPYLMEYPYECNEQTFSRYYANALASHIANSNPRIQEVFNQWKNTDALLSNLEKNQELKSILIQETPWLRDAQSETEQKKRIALLFDLNKMNNELSRTKRKLEQNQMSNGAWSWFGDYRANRYITQHIIAGFGHLKKLDVSSSAVETSKMIDKALNYLDAEFIQEYKDIRKYDKDADLNIDRLSYTQLHYLYMRSFFPNNKPNKEVSEIMDYYHSQIKNYWLKRPLYAKGMMALVTHRNKDEVTSKKILNSLKETSITSEELGMYWKANTSSWHWYQAPIETQALMIEAFSEAGTTIQTEAENIATIDELKIWLLKNKQTNRWKTTKATTEAVYALLLQGNNWLSVTDMVEVIVGNQPISPSKLEAVKVEAGTGYYKTSWSGNEIKPEMAEVKISKKGNGIAWGSMYWQYFEDLDKITSAETPLKLKKKLFKKTNTDKGEVLTDITKNTKLEVGDLVSVRIELRSDRAMEFVHMKDMRAAGLEPINVLSQYKYQDGLGYYEATKDASTNFFFDYLPKGVYVFEYDLRVSNAGNMSNGITTIQSMYAPEFNSHSEGSRINVE